MSFPLYYCTKLDAPKTGKFSTDINYEIFWSNSSELLPNDIFEQWYRDGGYPLFKKTTKVSSVSNQPIHPVRQKQKGNSKMFFIRFFIILRF